MDAREQAAHDFCRTLMNVVDNMREAVLCGDPALSDEVFSSLTMSQGRLLRTVDRMTRDSREGVSLKDLAEKLCLSPSTVSVMVETLVGRGHLVRRPSSRDRRMVLIRLDDGGRETVDNVERSFTEMAGDYLKGVSLEDQKRLNDFLAGFGEYVNAYRKKVSTR